MPKVHHQREQNQKYDETNCHQSSVRQCMKSHELDPYRKKRMSVPPFVPFSFLPSIKRSHHQMQPVFLDENLTSIFHALMRQNHFLQTKSFNAEWFEIFFLFGDGGVQNLRAEEASLGLLNDLLVDVVGRVVHDDGTVLAINLGVETGITDEVNNPLLTIVRVEAKLGAEITDVHAAENLAVALADEVTSSLDKGVGGRGEEEVAAADLLSGAESLTSSVEVVSNVEGVDELGDGVGVLVSFLADVTDDVLELLLLSRAVARTGAAGDYGSNQVAQGPRARGLDGVDVGGREEHVQDGVASSIKVEQREERPVDQHGAVVELSTGVVEQLGIDSFADVLELVNGRLPVGGENLASELTPC